ncbi:MAG TPA: molybdopterin cofactor-binding domain-containing protein, partial [Candidatus Eisenbacteria bacterium]|nr:molybdopterin cofactor-binding domain-containing protein [Candidatus Eisenbacteria bacterium]
KRIAALGSAFRTVTVYRDYPYPDDVSYVCAQVAEVEIDTETGAVKVRRVTSAHDVGTVINPVTHQGQIEGATLMGVGQAVMEELALDNGRVTTANLGDYRIPVIADTPALETVLVDSSGGVGPLDAKPIGEFANNAPPAAIANAVAAAVGARIFDLPITAEKVYRAFKAAQQTNGTTRKDKISSRQARQVRQGPTTRPK